MHINLFVLTVDLHSVEASLRATFLSVKMRAEYSTMTVPRNPQCVVFKIICHNFYHEYSLSLTALSYTYIKTNIFLQTRLVVCVCVCAREVFAHWCVH